MIYVVLLKYLGVLFLHCHLLLELESADGCNERLIVDTYSVAADIALRDAAAIKSSADTKSLLADIAGCSSSASFDEVRYLFDDL